jgi:bifunctional UDP-N-acetylglucosamine pyrophosphorylase/glucosamine-1-phosphate N-acetyltransferase
MDRVAAVHHCELFGVVGTATDIGAGTVTGSLRFDDAETSRPVQGKRYTHPLATAAFIGDYSRTGINANFLPGAMTGANCAVGPGVIVGGKLPHGTLLTLKQELTEKTWGPENYGWGGEEDFS